MFKDTFMVKLKLKGYNFLNRDKVIILEGEEASILKTLEFMEKSEKADFEIIEFIYNFFNTCSKGKINKKIFTKYIANNLGIILEIIKKTYIKGVYDSNIGEKQEKTGEFEYKTDKEDIIISLARVIAFLTEKMSIDPNKLLETYTWRQIQFRTKHYLYLEREKTEKGREENQKEDNKRKIDKNKAELEAEFAKLENYLKKS